MTRFRHTFVYERAALLVMASGALLTGCERSVDCDTDDPLLTSMAVLAEEGPDSAKEAAQARLAQVLPAGLPVDGATKLLRDAGFEVSVSREQSTIDTAVWAYREMNCGAGGRHAYRLGFARSGNGIDSPLTVSVGEITPFAPPPVGEPYFIATEPVRGRPARPAQPTTGAPGG